MLADANFSALFFLKGNFHFVLKSILFTFLFAVFLFTPLYLNVEFKWIPPLICVTFFGGGGGDISKFLLVSQCFGKKINWLTVNWVNLSDYLLTELIYLVNWLTVNWVNFLFNCAHLCQWYQPQNMCPTPKGISIHEKMVPLSGDTVQITIVPMISPEFRPT
jgi:hypothetical protein